MVSTTQAADVTDNTPHVNAGNAQPEPFTEPPTGQVQYPNGQPESEGNTMDPADEVAALVEVAMNDPEGATEDGALAAARLEEMAWAAGVTKDQTAAALNWAAVAEMALGNLPTAAVIHTPTVSNAAVIVGGKHKFAKRTKDGAKLKNAKGEEFPSQEVEVVAVDAAAKTCIVKSARDGKEVVDIRTKKPVAVKFEWLE